MKNLPNNRAERRPYWPEERAISDVLGYILIFSLITSSIAIVYTGGYGALVDVRNAERLNNAERAFDVLDTNIEDMTHRGAPSRATEIKLAGASIGFGDSVTFNVSLGPKNYTRTTLSPIVFSIGEGNSLVYSNGAIIRDQKSGSVLLDPPAFQIGSPTVITLVETRAHGSGISGSGRVLVRTVAASREVTRYPGVEGNISINVTTTRTGAWKRYLEEKTDETNGNCEVIGHTVSCQFTTSSVYLQVVKVDVFII
ncbi:MAG: hypothetical protein ABEI52_01645 [Halobacteriaceae archaeon]